MPQFSRKRIVFSVFFPLSLIVVTAFLTAGRTVQPQAQTLTAVNKIQTNPVNVGVTKTALVKPVVSSAAVSRNSGHKTNLNWTFGGKIQRGWYLYEPLIHQLVNFDSAAAGSNFDDVLMLWQTSAGLKSDGELNNDSFGAMVKHWQSQRLKSFAEATSDELITAPAAEFWDTSRPSELRQVERETYAAYKKMLAAAAADKTLKLNLKADGTLADEEKFLKIVSAYRSPAYQLKLRQAEPNAGRAALAVRSPHFTGRALDLYVGGEPVTTKDENRLIQIKTPAYLWLVKNAHKFGFRPYFYEPWHWEYVGISER